MFNLASLVKASLLLAVAALLLTGCNDDDNPAVMNGNIVPGVNPAFDAVTEVAVSATAGGNYAAGVLAASAYSYDPATESLSLEEVPESGLYVRIRGTVGATAYTIYTYVEQFGAVAANELTSLAVGQVAAGLAGDFDAAVAAVAANPFLDLDPASIVAAVPAAERDVDVTAAMAELAAQFDDASLDQFMPGDSDLDAVIEVMPGVQATARGALAWENWTKVAAGGPGALPAGETNADYVRCKSCHGWDQRGTDGGYVRRSRTQSRPNAGAGDSNDVSRDVSMGGYVAGDVQHTGTGRSWAEGTGSWDGGSQAGYSKGNEHPDFSQDGGLSEQQVADLVAFLNNDRIRDYQVFSAIDTAANPVAYTVVDTASAAAGEAFYNTNCAGCHGAPADDSTASSNNAPGAGGIVAYLLGDGKFSELMHKAQWGAAGTIMTREAMGYPNVNDIANLLKYLQVMVEGEIHAAQVRAGALAWDNWTKVASGGAGLPAGEGDSDYLRCKSCHGWDQLGIEGGYVRRSRNAGRPNAGAGDAYDVSRNVSTGDYLAADILHTGTGRLWTEGSSAWNDGAGYSLGNMHPDFSQDGGLSDAQVTNLLAFLNEPTARADQVFSAIDTSVNPVAYTLVASANAIAGQEYYANYCAGCHGQPGDDSTGTTEHLPGAGGIIAYLQSDGKYSELKHKVNWGVPGTTMTWEAMGEPTPADVANVLKYLQDAVAAHEAGLPVATDDAAVTDGDTPVDINVLANDSDSNDVITVTDFDAGSIEGGTVSCTAQGICTYTRPADFTGVDSFGYTITGGSDTDSATVAVTVTDSAGDAVAAGQAYYDVNCAGCHKAGAYDANGLFSDLAGTDKLVTDLGTINVVMGTLGDNNDGILTQQQVDNLQAFLDALVL